MADSGQGEKKGCFHGHRRRHASPTGPTKSCPVSQVHRAGFCSIVEIFPASFLTSNVCALPYLECVSQSFKMVALLNKYPGLVFP